MSGENGLIGEGLEPKGLMIESCEGSVAAMSGEGVGWSPEMEK